MKNRRAFCKLLALLFLVGIGVTRGGDGLKPQYGKSEKAFYLSEADMEWIEPGLKLEIKGVEFAPPLIQVTLAAPPLPTHS